MSNARREAFSRLGETCGKVQAAMRFSVRQALDDGLLTEQADPEGMAWALADAAFDVAVQKGTTPLRDALIECEEERLTAARERDDLAEEVETLKRRIDELETEVTDAQGERDEANERADRAEAQIT